MSNLNPDDLEAVRRFATWKHRRRSSRLVSDDEPSLSDVYDELMKTAFAPALRAEGLRGSGGRFEMPSSTHWAQVGFQKSAFNDRNELRFTVNLSVIRRDEWDAQTASKPYLGSRPKPSTRYGDWAEQSRIGNLTPSREDKWWRLTGGAATAAVRDDVLHDLLEYGVPWMRDRVR